MEATISRATGRVTVKMSAEDAAAFMMEALTNETPGSVTSAIVDALEDAEENV